MASLSPEESASSSSPSSSTSSPSVDSYIGNIISLTSKSEIRYEGVLVSINTKESTIALKNVKSFGTEGRRKEGPQIPASDKVYEYILFRGSDIKDLQVKSSSSIDTKQQTYNDPAIIQSQYAYAPNSIPAASAGIIAPTGLSSNMVHQGLPRQTYPDTYTLYQTGAQSSPWALPPILANADGSMHPQGYVDTSSGQTHVQQQSYPVQPQLVSLQKPLQYPEGYAPTSVPSFPETATSSTIPSQFLVPNPSNSSSLLSSNKSLSSPFPSNVPAMPYHASYNQESNSTSLMSNKVGLSQASFLPVSSMPFSASLGSASDPTTPPPHLLTPDQLTKSVPAASHSHKLQPESQDMGALLPPPSSSSSVFSGMPQEPLLPLPTSSQQGEHRVTQFTEEFDFTAMNEKFNKDEVWGSLGKEKQRGTTGDGTEADTTHYYVGVSGSCGQDPPKPESRPVYNKDDFFDTLSCNSLNRGGWSGRTRLSDRMRQDTETFGETQQRPPPGLSSHGNYGGPGSGYYRDGSYNRGRGFGYYGGRGRGGYSGGYNGGYSGGHSSGGYRPM